MYFLMVEIFVKDQTKKIRLKDVLHMFNIKKNFFLMNKLVLNGFKVHFNTNRYFVKTLCCDNFSITLRDGKFYFIYWKKVSTIEIDVIARFPQDQDKFGIFNWYLCHLNEEKMKDLQSIINSLDPI